MAETSGLLNRRRGITPTEGSNPSVSASRVVTRHSPQLRIIAIPPRLEGCRPRFPAPWRGRPERAASRRLGCGSQLVRHRVADARHWAASLPTPAELLPRVRGAQVGGWRASSPSLSSKLSGSTGGGIRWGREIITGLISMYYGNCSASLQFGRHAATPFRNRRFRSGGTVNDRRVKDAGVAFAVACGVLPLPPKPSRPPPPGGWRPA